jgi:uncharacterized YigZ family protein
LSDSYQTIAGYYRSEIKIKRSRFIATINRTADPNAAIEFRNSIAKEFHNATHNCFAYRIGCGTEQVFRYSDDGEPSGTAGRPILEALDRFELIDTCLVVTRYFGGIKLGTGGLGRAYRDAALAVIEKADIQTRYLTDRLSFTFPLNFTGAVLRAVSTEVVEVVESRYTDVGMIICDVRQSWSDRIRQSLVSITNGRVEFMDE